MTQSIESMIEVLQAYKDEKKIEYRSYKGKTWTENPFPLWNFSAYQYRIAPDPKKKVKLEAWIMRGELRWFDDTSVVVKSTADKEYRIRVPSEDKEIEI